VRFTRDTLFRAWWVTSLSALAFACGLAVGVFKLFPYEWLQGLGFTARELIRYPKHTFGIAPQKFLAAEPPLGGGVTRHVEGRAFPGLTLITGFFDGSLGVRLIDPNGDVLNHWPISYNAIWQESPHLADQPQDWDMELHGALLMPDGDVIFTFQYGGLVRMDACGDIRWKLPRQTHHVFTPDSEGNLWVPDRKGRESPVPRYAKVPAPFEEDYVIKVSPEGRVLEEFSILELIYRARLEGLLFANGAHDTELTVPLSGDFVHLNDVDVLTEELAPAFPLFEAGDLLLSLRNVNLLMVVHPDTQKVKWTRTGPFLRQHDPDFLPDGRISVFDNRRDETGNHGFGGSRILSIDPRSVAGDVTIYGARPGQHFYTDTMGDHQPLENGNQLISESEKGHAFEIAPDGTVVWSWVNRWKDGSVGKISQATRYPANYLSQPVKESCHET
jgi:Arylsulfotransferase (ASST)